MGTLTTDYELVIIGAGPAGLSAAVYAAREGMRTVVFDKGVVGGMAALTDIIDNYPGFDKGVSGLDLADHLHDHATRFGANVKTGVTVTSLEKTTDHIIVRTSDGPISTGAVLIATGSTYKYLGVPGEKDFVGRGVHFCATCDAPLYRGKDLIVVGGGNSAIQESLFIAKFAKHVTLLVRGPELGGTKYLKDELQALPNVSFRYDTVVTEIRNDGTKVTGIHTKNHSTGDNRDLRTDAVFVFIGLTANSEAFTDTLKLDDRGFIVTDADYATSVPGIYAAGDVRSGSTWQIASAVGEGVTATMSIREHLNTRRRAQAKRKAKAAVTKKAAPTRKAKSLKV